MNLGELQLEKMALCMSLTHGIIVFKNLQLKVNFVNMWGYFGQADTPFAIWGPRDIAIDSKGNLFITDTGNKRIVDL